MRKQQKQSQVSIKTDGISQQPQILSQKVHVQPAHNLQFICTQFQTTASIRIYIEQGDEQLQYNYRYRYNIQSTNRKDYKVTQPSGQLVANQRKVIYIYLRQSAPINTNLKDRFLLQIMQSNGYHWDTIYLRKFAIIIESALQNQSRTQNLPARISTETTNVSKFMETLNAVNQSQRYPTNASRIEMQNDRKSSILKVESSIRGTHYRGTDKFLQPIQSPQNQRLDKDQKLSQRSRINSQYLQRSLGNKQNPDMSQAKTSKTVEKGDISQYSPQMLYIMKQQEQEQKKQLSSTIHEIEQKKREIIMLENQNKSIEARARFTIYRAVILVLVAFVLGLWVKSLDIPLRVQHFVGTVKHKIGISGNQPTQFNQVEVSNIYGPQNI